MESIKPIPPVENVVMTAHCWYLMDFQALAIQIFTRLSVASLVQETALMPMQTPQTAVNAVIPCLSIVAIPEME